MVQLLSEGRVLPPREGAFWLTVQVTFKRAEDVDIFKTAFAPLAAFVEKNEPRTLSYSMAQSDKDPKTVLLFERYVDKNDAYLEVHRKSAPFKVFRPQLAAMEATISGESYIESNMGFMS